MYHQQAPPLGDGRMETARKSPRDSFLFFVLPRKCLGGGAVKFEDINKGKRNVDEVDPLEMLKILFTLVTVTHESHMGAGPVGDLGDEDDASERGGGKRISIERAKPKQFFEDDDGVEARVEMYVEYIRSTGGEIRGWRFVFQTIDPSFSFDIALTNLFLRYSMLQKRTRGKPVKVDENALGPFTTKDAWITEGLNTYVEEKFYKSAAANQALMRPLKDPRNPAQCKRVFTFERSQYWIGQLVDVHPKYSLDYFAKADSDDAGEDTSPMSLFGDDDGAGSVGNMFVRRYDDPTPDWLSASRSTDERSQSGATNMAHVGVDVRLKFPEPAAYVYPQNRKPEDVFGYDCFSRIQVEEKDDSASGMDDMTVDGGDLGGDATRHSTMSNSQKNGVLKKRQDRKNRKTKNVERSSAQGGEIYYTNLHKECCALERGEEWVRPDDPPINMKFGEEDDDERNAPDPQFPDAVTGHTTDPSKGDFDDTIGARKFWEKIQSGDSIQVIKSVLDSDEDCPATAIAYEYLQQLIDEDPDQSLIRPFDYLIDSSLTVFGNFAAYDLLQFEYLFTLTSLHQELHLIQVSSLQAFDIQYKTRIHFLVSGKAATGKSFLFDVYRDELTIKGIVKAISVQTRRALTADSNYNGLSINIDELNDFYTSDGVDGTGFGDIKEVLTNGILITESVFVTEDGKRLPTFTKSQRRSKHLCGTNVPFYQIVEPIRTRFAKITVPMREIVGKDSTEAGYRNQRLANIDEMKKDYQKIWYTRQGVASILYLLMRMKTIPRIDVTIVEKLMPIVCDYLKSLGFEIHIRDRERIYLHIQAVCMFDAINKVFFTDMYYEAGTPWDIRQVFTCVPLLTCTREHFWFGFSQIFQTFVNPYQDEILEAMMSIVNDATDEDRFTIEVSRGGKPTSTPNYNYYLINVAQHAAHGQGTLDVASTMIARRLAANKTINLDKGNVRDFLEWMDTQCIDAPKYNSIYGTGNVEIDPEIQIIEEEDGDVKETHRVDVIQELRSGTRWGLEISRHFMDTKLKYKYMEILEMCIRKTMDPVPPGREPRVIVIGESLRRDAPGLRNRWNKERGLPTDDDVANMQMLEGGSRKRRKRRGAELELKQRPELFHCIIEGPDGTRDDVVEVSNDNFMERTFRHIVAISDMKRRKKHGAGGVKRMDVRNAIRNMRESASSYVPKRIKLEDLDEGIKRKWYEKIGYEDKEGKDEHRRFDVEHIYEGNYPYNMLEYGSTMDDAASVASRTSSHASKKMKQAWDNAGTPSSSVQDLANEDDADVVETHYTPKYEEDVDGGYDGSSMTDTPTLRRHIIQEEEEDDGEDVEEVEANSSDEEDND